MPLRPEERVWRWMPASVRTVDIEARLRQRLAPDTLAHVYRVAEVALTLAECHAADPNQAELAALLHEVADVYSEAELISLAEYYEIPVDPTEARVPRLLHGKLGAEVLRDQWEIGDEELLAAVRTHVAGAPRMGTLAKIIFLADKLEPERDRFYGGLDPVRRLAMTDLDAAIGKLWAWQNPTLASAEPTGAARFAAAEHALIELTRATWPS